MEDVFNLWSTPSSLTNISTMLMYSFAQRDDMEVLDEPLYANFLRVRDAERPYREQVLAKMHVNYGQVSLPMEFFCIHKFLMKNGLVKTPHYDCCFTGVTREIVIDLLAKKSVIPEEGHIVPSDLYNADVVLIRLYLEHSLKVWTTSTMGDVSPVTMIDGRVIGDGQVGNLTCELQITYRNLTKQCEVLPIPTYDKISNLSEVVTYS